MAAAAAALLLVTTPLTAAMTVAVEALLALVALLLAGLGAAGRAGACTLAWSLLMRRGWWEAGWLSTAAAPLLCALQPLALAMLAAPALRAVALPLPVVGHDMEAVESSPAEATCLVSST